MAANSGRLREAVLPSAREAGGPIGFKLSRAKAFFWTVFGTAILPTGTSGPSSRGEASPNRSQNGPFPMHQSVFGTESRPTGAPGASRRDEGGLLDGLWHGYPAHRCSRGILAWRRGSSFRPLARLPCSQVPNCYPRGVHKQSADG